MQQATCTDARTMCLFSTAWCVLSRCCVPLCCDVVVVCVACSLIPKVCSFRCSNVRTRPTVYSYHRRTISGPNGSVRCRYICSQKQHNSTHKAQHNKPQRRQHRAWDNGGMDGWMDACKMDGWMDGWMDGCRDGLMNVYIRDAFHVM